MAASKKKSTTKAEPDPNLRETAQRMYEVGAGLVYAARTVDNTSANDAVAIGVLVSAARTACSLVWRIEGDRGVGVDEVSKHPIQQWKHFANSSDGYEWQHALVLLVAALDVGTDDPQRKVGTNIDSWFSACCDCAEKSGEAMIRWAWPYLQEPEASNG